MVSNAVGVTVAVEVARSLPTVEVWLAEEQDRAVFFQPVVVPSVTVKA